MKICAAAFEHIFLCVWPLLETFQCFLRNVRLLLKDISVRLLLKENVELIFCACAAASGNILYFLMNVRLLLKDINVRLLLKENVQLLLRIMSTQEIFRSEKQIKIKTMEAYSFIQPATFIYFWLKYCDENHIERIPIAVENIDHLFHLACEIIETDRLHQFLLSDGTRIDDNEYLESLENGTELIVCTEEQIQKLSFYFELKRNLRLQNISYPLNINYFI